MFKSIPTENLSDYVKRESSITHSHSLSYLVSLATAIILRNLITGSSFAQAVDAALLHRKFQKKNDTLTKFLADIAQDKLIVEVLKDTEGTKLNDGGYSPDVLRAALYWIRKTDNFTDAVEHSIAFAGPANYCPVLVGAFAGALYGESSITEKNLSKVTKKNPVERVVAVAEALAVDWKK